MSAERAKKYAQWIVDNQDKKDTPEFATVVKLRGGEANIAPVADNRGNNMANVVAGGINTFPARIVGGIADAFDATPQLLNLLPGEQGYTTISEGVFGLDRNPIGTEALTEASESVGVGLTADNVAPRFRGALRGGEVLGETIGTLTGVGAIANAAWGQHSCAGG